MQVLYAAWTMTDAPVSHLLIGRTRANDVLHRMRDDIVSCVLRPGQKLKFETLREIYGVSFSTLREALSRLASEQLVVGKDNAASWSRRSPRTA